MSLSTTASQLPAIISSSQRKARYDLMTPPPAAHASLNQAHAGLRYGLVDIISAERHYVKSWHAPCVKTRCTGCGAEAWANLNNLTRGLSKGCRRCSRP